MNERTVNAITEYEPITAALASVEKYRGLIVDVTTPKGLAEAKSAHREVAALRIALEKTRKKVKEDVLARGKLIDSEANRIFALIASIEDPIKLQIEAEERREQEAREAAIKAEQDRLAAEERVRKEAEERRLAEERAKNEAEARRLAEQRAALEAEQKAAREKAEAEDRARRAKIEEEERAAKQRIEAAEARAKRQVEEERLAAEREAIDKARREQEERERQARLAQEKQEREDREAKEAIERAARRKAAELLDARQTLETFEKRHGDEPEFGAICAAIRAYFERQRRRAA